MRKNKKLSYQRAGPFHVIRKVGTLTYELDSPGDWKIRLVISVLQLEPTNINDSLDRVWPGQPLTILQDGDMPAWEIFEIEDSSIAASVVTDVSGRFGFT